MSTETLEQPEVNQQVAIIERSAAVFQAAPEILLANQSRGEKAIEVGKSILQSINENGMSPELDERAMKYMSNCSKALSEMKESRSEVTQIMDALKKMYTEVENKLDSKKPGTVPSIIQGHRDSYAKEVFEAKEKKRIAAEREEARAKEAIEIKYQMQESFTNQYNDYLLQRKSKMQSAFNNIILETYTSKSEALKNVTFKLEHGISDLTFSRNNFKYSSTNEIIEIQKSVLEEMGKDIEANFMAEMNLLKDELVEKLPSKLNELQEAKRIADEEAAEAEKQRLAEIERQKKINAANAKEKERLEKEAVIAREAEQKRLADLKAIQEQAEADKKKREEEENDRMAKEADDKRQKQLQESELKKQGEQTMAMFDKEASIAESGPAPDARQGYEINVLHAAGYVQIFQFWFENEGKNIPLDKFGNTKVDQMKAFCEKTAHKTGEMIESKFLKYEPTFKAINKKAK